MLSFRDYHTIKILEGYSQNRLPLDAYLRNYLKENKAVGSKDRNIISKNIYFIIRNLSLIDSHLSAPITWPKRLNLINSQVQLDTPTLPTHVRYSCPKWLYEILKSQYEDDALVKILKTSLTEAPLTIRTNTLKIAKVDLKKLLEHSFVVTDAKYSKNALKFTKREPLTSHETFKNGFFEIQDEASQLACEMLDIKPGDSVLDYCAGAGGKSLAIGATMNNKGVIYIHDVRSRAIQEAKKRFERAGIHNIQFFDPKRPLPSSLNSKCDYVIVDVPCSGTGTFRRNPDLKWKLSALELDKLKADQRTIFNDALSYVKPNGYILYSTCSILSAENQKQIDYFLKTHGNLKIIKDLVLLPEENGHDGFFACLMQLVNNVDDLCLADKDKK